MKEKSISLAIGLLVGVLVYGSFAFGLFSGLENVFEDLLFSVKPIHSDITIVAIDSDSINQLGQWPWPRKLFADALLELNKAAPKAVGLDVIFSEASRFGDADDGAFVRALRSISYPIVLPLEASLTVRGNGVFEAINVLKPLPAFLEPEKVFLGSVNLAVDQDGIARRLPLTIKDGEITHSAFSYEVAEHSGNSFSKESLGRTPRIVYAAPPGSIRRIPFSELINGGAAERLKGKLVFIGATAPDLHDEQLTPFSRGTLMSGVEIQANIANMFLSGYRLNPLSPGLTAFWIIGASLCAALVLTFFRRSLWQLAINIGIGIIYTIFIIILFEYGVVANFLHINFSWILGTGAVFSHRYWSGERERRVLKDAFSKYVAPEVLDHIMEEPGRIALGGEEKEITILFSDIRGFTTLSEKTTPHELVHILNRYFTVMTKIIFDHKGVVDKFIGDAIMAFWGAPLADSNQAENATKAGVAMLAALGAFNKELEVEGRPPIDIGVGIYTGPAIVGNVGSDQRFDYTAMGDSVNVASRLEGVNKTYGTHLIIGESTKNKLPSDYGLKPIGSVEVKGRKQPLTIYGR